MAETLEPERLVYQYSFRLYPEEWRPTAWGPGSGRIATVPPLELKWPPEADYPGVETTFLADPAVDKKPRRNAHRGRKWSKRLLAASRP